MDAPSSAGYSIASEQMPWYSYDKKTGEQGIAVSSAHHVCYRVKKSDPEGRA